MKKKFFGFLTAILTLGVLGGTAFVAASDNIQKEEAAHAATVTFNGNNYLYLKPGPWNVDGAQFVAYCWGGTAGSKFAAGSECPNDPGVYRMKLPAGTYTSCIMLRKSSATLDWNNEWNRVGDITFSSSSINCITVTGWQNTNYTQSTFTETPATQPTLTVEEEATVYTTQTYKLNAKLENSSDTITYTSNDETIATVDSTGLITGVSVGTTTITVKAGSLSETVNITVKNHIGITGDLYLNINTWKDVDVSFSAWVFAHTDSQGAGAGEEQWLTFEAVDDSDIIFKITIPQEFDKGADIVILRHPSGTPDWGTAYNKSRDITSSATANANYIEADGFSEDETYWQDENEHSYLNIEFDKELNYEDVTNWSNTYFHNVCEGEEEMTDETWGNAKTAYNNLSGAEQTLISTAGAKEDGSALQHALATYYHLVSNRHFEDFANRVEGSSSTRGLMFNDNNEILLIVIISLGVVTTTALFFYRKKRTQA